MTPAPLMIWTIGHSTRTLEEFTDLLRENQIQTLVDVRHYPGSRRYPHFNKAALNQSLPAAGIKYEHLLELGGRRPTSPQSHNTRWRHPAFRGYADYMETAPFREGIDGLLKIAKDSRVAIMCSEAVWWRCHRALIADHLKSIGIQVIHILGHGKADDHPYTSAAQILNGKLSYAESTLADFARKTP